MSLLFTELKYTVARFTLGETLLIVGRISTKSSIALASITVTRQEAVISPSAEEAVMVVVPGDFAVIIPFSTEATDADELSHFTVLSVAFSGRTLAFKAACSPGSSSIFFLLKEMDVTFISGS